MGRRFAGGAPIAQLAEAADLKSAQCRFESDWGHCVATATISCFILDFAVADRDEHDGFHKAELLIEPVADPGSISQKSRPIA